jgi:hypothetical protein
MKNQYQITINEFIEIHEIPGAWTKEDYIKLLNKIDYDDVASIPEDELADMAILGLSDLDYREAVKLILELRFGEKLTKGQRENLVDELREEKLWEEYGDISFHKELFNVSCLLYRVYPKKFHEPDILKITLEISALNTQSVINLQSPKVSFLARILNDGMDDHNIIRRLFSKQMASNNFTEAEGIIWQFEGSGFDSESRTNTITIYTSWNWADELKGVDSWHSAAFSDGQLQ